MGKSVLIGDFLHRIKRPIELDAKKHYKLVTIKMNHKGVVLRHEKVGADIKSKMYEVKEGDFILSGIDARNGAFGIVPKELDGAIVTNDFWYFDIDKNVVDKHLFLELTSTQWFDEICRKGSDGTTQRIRLQKNKFFNQEINLPAIEKQGEFISWFKKSKQNNNDLTGELTHQQILLKKLRQSILQEAIKGKLTVDWRQQNPDIEPASELLTRIQAEKEQLIKDKKIKKQKPLPPISEDEKPFELPEGWVWCRIFDVAKLITSGSRDWAKYYSTKGAIFVTMGNLSRGHYELKMSTTRYVQAPKSGEGTRTKLEENDLLVSITGDVGNLGLIPKHFGEAYINQHICLLRFMPECKNRYFPELMRSPLAKYQYDSPQRGIKNSFRLGDVGEMIIPLPPVKEQEAIAKRIDVLLSFCDKLQTQITNNQTHAEQLMQAVLKEAFAKNIEKPKESKIIELKPRRVDYYKRMLLAAEIVDQLHKEPTLGHLKLQKLIFLCQRAENMQLPTNFLQQAAGPYDPAMARSLDTQLKKKKWFEYQKDEFLKYKPLENARSHRNDYKEYFTNELVGVQFLIDTFRKAKSDQLEIVATLYACWEKIFKQGASYSEVLLVKEFYAWSEEKGKYEEERVRKAITWMQEKNIVPNS